MQTPNTNTNTPPFSLGKQFGLAFPAAFPASCLRIIALLAFISSSAMAHNKVVVIPMAGDDLQPLKYIVTVAKENGDFTDPVAAVNSITDASSSKPYLVVIAPGIYTLSSRLSMKSYVDVAGSGANITKLVGSFGALGGVLQNDALLIMESNSNLSDIGINNSGSGNLNAIGVSSASGLFNASLKDVAVIASGGTTVYGIYNPSSFLKMIDTSVTASGSLASFGIYNTTNLSNGPSMTRVSAFGVGAVASNIGIFNRDTEPNMDDVTAKASTSTIGSVAINYGVYIDTASVDMSNIKADATGGTNNYGVYIDKDSDARIRRSTLTGTTTGLFVQGIILGAAGDAFVSQSTLTGIVGGLGGRKCVAVDDNVGNLLSAVCN